MTMRGDADNMTMRGDGSEASSDEFVARLPVVILDVGQTAVTLEKIRNGVEAKVEREMQRGVPVLVLNVWIGAASNEKLHASTLTVLTSDDER